MTIDAIKYEFSRTESMASGSSSCRNGDEAIKAAIATLSLSLQHAGDRRMPERRRHVVAHYGSPSRLDLTHRFSGDGVRDVSESPWTATIYGARTKAKIAAATTAAPLDLAVTTKYLDTLATSSAHGAGKSTSANFTTLDLSTMTAQQRALYSITEDVPRDVLMATPALLAAVRAAFQTAGGRELALEAQIYDADFVGDLAQPAGAAHGRRLTETPPLRFQDVYRFASSFPLSKRRQVEQLIDAVAENSPTFRNMMVKARQRYFHKLPIGVDPQLPGAASIRPRSGRITLRDSGAPAEIVSTIVFETSNGANLDYLTTPRHHDLTRSGNLSFTPQYAATLDRQAARIYAGQIRQSPAAMTSFVNERIMQPDIQAAIHADVRQHYAVPSAESAQYEARVTSHWDEKVRQEALSDPATLVQFLKEKFGEHRLRIATHLAVRTEYAETASVFNHMQVFAELRSRARQGMLTGVGPGSLDLAGIAQMDTFRSVAGITRGALPIPRFEIETRIVNNMFETGHTSHYLNYELGQPRSRLLYFPETAEITAIDGAAQPKTPGKQIAAKAPAETVSAVDTHAETEAASMEGMRASAIVDQQIADTAGKSSSGSIDTETARADSEAALVTQSEALAGHILASPSVRKALKVGGKLLTAAAVAGLTVELGQAIRTDVNNGDKNAGASVHKIFELVQSLGGAGIGSGIGASLGSAAGATVGSVVPGLGTAVGAVAGAAVGSFVGGILGYAAGRVIAASPSNTFTRALDIALADHSPQPSHGVLGNLLDDPDGNGQRLIVAGSVDDKLDNFSELTDAFKTFGYQVSASKDQLNQLIAAYSGRGDGALSATEIAAAIRDKVLVVQPDGSVTVDPYQFTINVGSGSEPVQASHIAARLITFGSAKPGSDARLNAGELNDGLNAAGYHRASGTDAHALGLVLNAYDRDGDGAVGQQDLANALSDQAIFIGTDGAVSINASRILGQSGGQSRNIALRVITAGSHNDAFANRGELHDGLSAAGYDSKLNKDDYTGLVARYGSPGVGALSVSQLQKAIDDGALVFHEGGSVSVAA